MPSLFELEQERDALEESIEIMEEVAQSFICSPWPFGDYITPKEKLQ